MAILKNTVINDTGYLTLPSGPSGTRPGGSVDVFTRVGTTTWTAPAGVTSVQVVVVGGGGPGVSGGGGAGSVVYHSGLAVTPGTSYTVTVGAGGVGGVANGAAGRSAGMPSVFASITAPGGGMGGSNDSNPAATTGGSGGGGGATSTVTQVGAAATAGTGGTASYQNAGGSSPASAAPYAAAGGGGAGEAGQAQVNASTSGKGGNGITDASLGGLLALANAGEVIAGTRYIGGGGGGNTWQNGLLGGRGGYGGGGNGSFTEAVTTPAQQAGNVNGIPGQANTGGGGGGGAGGSGGRGGDGGSGIVIIKYTLPTSSVTPVNGMIRYNSVLDQPEQYLGGSWRVMPMPFIARTIITTAYTMGGYKDSVAWNNVNRTVAATDTTTNLGDNSMERTFNYQSAGVGKDNAFIFGAANAAGTASNYIIGYNMRSETQLTSGFTRTMANNNYNTGTVFMETDLAWNAGGGAAVIEEFNFSTQTMYLVNASIGWATETWAMSHEKFGIFFTSESANNFEFSTRTITARAGTAPSAHHQQKAVNSKGANCYAGNEGTYNGGNWLRRTNMITNSTAGITKKPYQNCGEENFTLGQEHQYMIGCYDTLQNNTSWRFNYASEAGYVGSSTLQPKGKGGQSSASNAWRS